MPEEVPPTLETLLMVVCLGITYKMSKEGTKGLFMSKETCFPLVKFLRPNRKAK